MNEYLLLVRGKGDTVGRMPKGQQAEHIRKVSEYIKGLQAEGKLRDAQPLKPQGAIVHKTDGKLGHMSLDVNREVISGFYYILADDLDEAIKIAKADPRFEDGNWKIEVRPVMLNMGQE